MYLGGLRPNTVILGFYDEMIPEDKLRLRSSYKRRWLRSIQQEHKLPSETNTIAFESLNSIISSSTTTNTNDIDPIMNFPGRLYSILIV